MSMSTPLPPQGDTSWYDWATEIHDKVDDLPTGGAPPLPAVAGTVGQVLAIDTVSPLTTEWKDDASGSGVPLPAVAGTVGQVLAIDTVSPLATEWVPGLGAVTAESVSIVDADNHYGVESDVEGALASAGATMESLDTRTTALESASVTFNPLAQKGLVLHLVYNGTTSRFEYPGDTATAPVLTGRVCTVEWEATSARIPAQGTGVSDFRPGDKAIVRVTEYAS